MVLLYAVAGYWTFVYFMDGEDTFTRWGTVSRGLFAGRFGLGLIRGLSVSFAIGKDTCFDLLNLV